MSEKNIFNIENLGAPKYRSPLQLSTVKGDRIFNFVSESDRLVFDLSMDYYNHCLNDGESPVCME